MLSYEDLITNPEKELTKLCEWFQVPFLPSMIDFHTSAEAQKTATSGEMWQNVKSPVMSQNFNKWLKQMTAQQHIDFEAVAGTSLKALGYQTFIAKGAETFTKEYLESLESENKAKKLQTRA